jgi:menaquinone-dependent protoporphyrinogen IX oxidase
MQVLIIYASKKGASKKVAQHIAIGCRVTGIEPEIIDLKDSLRLFDYLHFLPFVAKGIASKEKIQDLAKYDLIFAGFDIHNLSESSELYNFIESNDFLGKKVALFCTYFTNRKHLDSIAEKFKRKNAEIYNTLSLRRKGVYAYFGLGSTDENDLIRAEAFAERTINNLLGRHITKESEKTQIRNYRK